MSDEIVHNLDGCEISLVGDDLDPEWESLLLDASSWQQRGLELTNTSAYLTIAGQRAARPPTVIPGKCTVFCDLVHAFLEKSFGPPSLPFTSSLPHSHPCLLLPLPLPMLSRVKSP